MPEINASDAYSVTYLDDYVSYEKDTLSVRNEGRKWYDYQMFSNSDLSYNIDLNVSGITADRNLSLRGNILSAALAPTTFDLSVNNQLIDNIGFPARPPGEFNSVGVDQSVEYDLPTSGIPNISSELKIELTYNPAEVLSNGYLDFFLLEFSRKPEFNGRFKFFRSLESTKHDISTFTIQKNVSISNIGVWDVSNLTAPISQTFSSTTNNVSFNSETETLKEFVIFDADNLSTPVSAIEIANQDILSNLNADGLIVTHPFFLTEANRLADFHRSHDQLNIAVVTTEEVYNEFSSGNQDITAIRDYVKYLYDGGNQKLKYLLLFGDCSFDYN